MSFLKFQADQLFTGTTLLPASAVLVCNPSGQIQDIIQEQEAGEDVQKLQGILSPGFINCHCHLELSHMKGLIPEGTGLVDFVFSVVTQRHFPDEEILEAVTNAEHEMMVSGIVAVGDICNNQLTLSQKQKQQLKYYNFIEASGWLPEVAEQRFSRSLQSYNAFSHKQPSAIVPHAPYSVSDNLWQLLQPGFAGKVVSIHNQETNFEDELFIQNAGDFTRMYKLMKMDTSFFKPTGKSSLQSYFRKLDAAAHIILVHNTFTNQADVEFVQQTRLADEVSFCLCVNANQYIEKALPPIEMLRSNHCRIVLGTDSLASNKSLSIWDEITTIRRNFPAIPLEEILGWATFNGAKALQMDQQLGIFEKGKTPGVVLLQPTTDPQEKQAQPKRLL